MYTITLRTPDMKVMAAVMALAAATDSLVSYTFSAKGKAQPRGRDWNGVDALGMAQELKIVGGMEARFVEEVNECVKRKGIIDLIKVIRHYTGLGLKESKDVADKHVAYYKDKG
jgi:ribosomal protein L7/L12